MAPIEPSYPTDSKYIEIDIDQMLIDFGAHNLIQLSSHEISFEVKEFRHFFTGYWLSKAIQNLSDFYGYFFSNTFVSFDLRSIIWDFTLGIIDPDRIVVPKNILQVKGQTLLADRCIDQIVIYKTLVALDNLPMNFQYVSKDNLKNVFKSLIVLFEQEKDLRLNALTFFFVQLLRILIKRRMLSSDFFPIKYITWFNRYSYGRANYPNYTSSEISLGYRRFIFRNLVYSDLGLNFTEFDEFVLTLTKNSREELYLLLIFGLGDPTRTKINLSFKERGRLMFEFLSDRTKNRIDQDQFEQEFHWLIKGWIRKECTALIEFYLNTYPSIPAFKTNRIFLSLHREIGVNVSKDKQINSSLITPNNLRIITRSIVSYCRQLGRDLHCERLSGMVMRFDSAYIHEIVCILILHFESEREATILKVLSGLKDPILIGFFYEQYGKLDRQLWTVLDEGLEMQFSHKYGDLDQELPPKTLDVIETLLASSYFSNNLKKRIISNLEKSGIGSYEKINDAVIELASDSSNDSLITYCYEYFIVLNVQKAIPCVLNNLLHNNLDHLYLSYHTLCILQPSYYYQFMEDFEIPQREANHRLESACNDASLDPKLVYIYCHDGYLLGDRTTLNLIKKVCEKYADTFDPQGKFYLKDFYIPRLELKVKRLEAFMKNTHTS